MFTFEEIGNCLKLRDRVRTVVNFPFEETEVSVEFHTRVRWSQSLHLTINKSPSRETNQNEIMLRSHNYLNG